MKYNILVVITILVLISSCKTKSTSEIQRNTDSPIIELKDVERIFKLTDIVIDSISIIKLSNDYTIGKCSKILQFKGFFFLSDPQTKSLLAFNNIGELKFIIDKKGRGPGEFVSITDFSIDPLNNHIYIYDEHLGKLLWYNMKGIFVGEKILGIIFRNIAIDSSENIYLFSDIINRYKNKNYPAGLWKYNIHKKEMTLLFEEKRKDLLLLRNGLNGFGSEIVFYPVQNKEAYKIEDGKLSLLVSFSYNSPNDNWWTSSILLSDKYLFAQCVEDNSSIFTLVNLKSLNSIIGKSFINDINGLPIGVPKLIKDKNLIFVAFPYDILNCSKYQHLISKFGVNIELANRKSKAITKNLKNNDNPLILEFKLK